MIDSGIAQPILVGTATDIIAAASRAGVSLDDIEIVEPGSNPSAMRYAKGLAHRRAYKGMTLNDAAVALQSSLYTAGMIVAMGDCDACVAGSISTTGDALSAQQSKRWIGTGISTVSSFFLIVFVDAIYAFADGAVLPQPTSAQSLPTLR